MINKRGDLPKTAKRTSNDDLHIVEVGQNVRAIVCSPFSDAVEEPCLCGGVVLRPQWLLRNVVMLHSRRPEDQHREVFKDPGKCDAVGF